MKRRRRSNPNVFAAQGAIPMALGIAAGTIGSISAAVWFHTKMEKRTDAPVSVAGLLAASLGVGVIGYFLGGQHGETFGRGLMYGAAPSVAIGAIQGARKQLPIAAGGPT